MAIHAGQVERGSAMRETSFRMYLAAAVNATNAYFASATLNGVTAPTTLTLVDSFTRQPISLAFTYTIASPRTATYRVTGENQFGDTIVEDVTLTGTGAAVTQHTLNCFRFISSIVLTSVSAGMVAGDVVAIGNSVTSSGTCRFPLWSKTIPSAAIKAITHDGGTLRAVPAGANLIVDTARWTVRETTNTLVSGQMAMIYVDPKYERYV